MSTSKLLVKAIVFVGVVDAVFTEKTWIRTNQTKDAYTVINTALNGNAVEVPDCSHEDFGQHITQRMDPFLQRRIFVFHIHTNPDNDRCQNFDRQRTEIKVPPNNAELKGFEGDTVTFSWNFWISPEFQTSQGFCAIHQIKTTGGNDRLPLINFSLRTVSDDKRRFTIEHDANDNTETVLVRDDLSKFTGVWIHAKEEITYAKNGKYSLVLSRVDNAQTLVSVKNDSIEMWRDGTDNSRPKWGIYRSLAEKDKLRDEQILFDSFCLSKDLSDKCI